MENTGYIAISHMTALRRRMDMIANNLANLSTASYKAEKPLFTSFHNESSIRGDKVTYVEDFGSIRNLEIGTITPTNNSLDWAINSEGYFTVETPEGERYTRAGQFNLNAEGEVVTRQGYPVLSEGGDIIIIPPNTVNITVSNDGTISADGTQIARVAPVRFENERELKKLTEGLYETDQEPQPVERFEIRQGMLEGSNVQPIIEMSQMIEVSRAYASTQRLVETEDERIKRALRVLSGANS